MITYTPPRQYCYRYPDGRTTYDRLTYTQNVPQLERKFFLGDNLEKYDFFQPLAESFSDLVIERLKQIRKKYSHTRLFFSGGKDSMLAFEASLRSKIYFDEIVILRHCPVGLNVPIGQLVESDANARDYLREIGYDKSKITTINFEPDQYNSIYQNPEWIHHGSRFHINSPLSHGYLFRFVNPAFRYLEDTPDAVNVVGSIQPHVYWADDQWKFTFVDLQFDQNLNVTTENFLVGDDFPEILHGYVKAISYEFDQRNIKLDRFQTTLPNIDIQDDNQMLRKIRDLVPEYGQLRVRRPDKELPKSFEDPWRPSDHDFWTFNDSYKTMIACMMLYNQDPWQQCFSNYVKNTDWEQLKSMRVEGGILSPEFTLSK